MKKNIIYLVVLLIIALTAAYFIHSVLTRYEHPGYVLMGFGHWALETTVVVYTVTQIVGFILLYIFFRLFQAFCILSSGNLTNKP